MAKVLPSLYTYAIAPLYNSDGKNVSSISKRDSAAVYQFERGREQNFNCTGGLANNNHDTWTCGGWLTMEIDDISIGSTRPYNCFTTSALSTRACVYKIRAMRERTDYAELKFDVPGLLFAALLCVDFFGILYL